MELAKQVRRGNHGCADIRWLLTVARSRFLDHARREQRGVRKLALVSTNDDYVDPPEVHEVLTWLGALQPIHRLVLVLRYVEDMPIPAVADTIGRNVTATNSLLSRARTELRRSSRSQS